MAFFDPFKNPANGFCLVCIRVFSDHEKKKKNFQGYAVIRASIRHGVSCLLAGRNSSFLFFFLEEIIPHVWLYLYTLQRIFSTRFDIVVPGISFQKDTTNISSSLKFHRISLVSKLLLSPSWPKNFLILHFVEIGGNSLSFSTVEVHMQNVRYWVETKTSSLL